MFIRKSKERFDVVSVNDQAVDRTSPEGKVALQRYVRERDPSVLVTREGARLTRFVMRPLPHDAVLEIEAERDLGRRCEMAFALSLERIEDLGFDALLVKKPIELFGGWEMVTDACRKSLAEDIGELVIREVGSVALQRALLSEHQKKAFSLPPGCGVDWGIDIPVTVSNTPTTGSGS